MTADRWAEIERLYQACIEMEPSDRVRFLGDACAEEGVRREVESLLSHRNKELSFIDLSSPAVMGEMVTRNTSKVGQTIGHYQVVSFLGSGGMGDVYRARDIKLGRDVAIKVLPDEFSQDPERVRRSEREAKLLASLNHPNI